MKNIIIRSAKILTPADSADSADLVDIFIIQGKIRKISKISKINHVYNEIDETCETIDLKGKYYVSAGWIDAHTHCFPESPIYRDDPDIIGVFSGVTTVIDAGSVGADDLDNFVSFADKAHTNVFAFLNVSRIGLIRQNELSNMNDISENAVLNAYKAHPTFIIGLKARMSCSVVGENGIKPLYRAKEIQKNIQKNIQKQYSQQQQQQQQQHFPLMIHIGNSPPELDSIADFLGKGDIITHCFNGKPNKILEDITQTNTQAKTKESIKKAIEKGVILDVGHGSASFNFEVAENAIQNLGLYPDIISSDIYSHNRINGPVYSLSNVMTKFLHLGLTLKQVIDSVTSNPAKALHLNTKGHLAPGYDGDLTIFELTNISTNTSTNKQQIVAIAAVIAGKWFLTTQGKICHDLE